MDMKQKEVLHLIIKGRLTKVEMPVAITVIDRLRQLMGLPPKK